MITLLLIIIYIAFISLGLPDSILGSAWPVMYTDFSVPVSYAGIVSMIIAGSTIVSSLFSTRLIQKLGTGKVTAISVSLTALGLLGFSQATVFWHLCIWAIPYGLGAGSVDSALNNYVALHYRSRHMSWLHCFWGVGATLGPYIMGLYLTKNLSWTNGYKTIGILQVILVVILFLSLPLWKKQGDKFETERGKNLPQPTMLQALKLPGAKAILIAFFCYCSLESTAGLWASSYLVLYKNMNPQLAAKWASLCYLGITIGRFLSGFISEKLGNKNMIRLGFSVIFIGILIFFIPITNNIFLALIIMGLGFAPIFPSFIHSTPENFGAANSQALIGLQMSSAYTGTTFMPPVFGFLASHISIGLYPFFLLFFAILSFLMLERINSLKRKKK